jgi:glycosyltransferase involved in cell wall biosynthesis
MTNPLISIIVPCYNQAQYLDECLQSVLDQVYENWECIIVNDGSPDNTEEVAMKWTESDNRFRYVKKDNGGISSARNFGINLAKGEWILPLDADDKIDCSYIKMAELEFENNYTVIYCTERRFGNDDSIDIVPDFSLKNLAIGNCIFCSAFFRKSDWKRVGGYDENLIYGLEDWEFWISVLKNNKTAYKLDGIYFFCRIKNQSRHTDLLKNQTKLRISYNYIYSKHIEFFTSQLGGFDELIFKINNIQNSRDYKIGNWILRPFRGIKKLFG